MSLSARIYVVGPLVVMEIIVRDPCAQRAVGTDRPKHQRHQFFRAGKTIAGNRTDRSVIFAWVIVPIALQHGDRQSNGPTVSTSGLNAAFYPPAAAVEPDGGRAAFSIRHRGNADVSPVKSRLASAGSSAVDLPARCWCDEKLVQFAGLMEDS
jgi:hypothetical protein